MTPALQCVVVFALQRTTTHCNALQHTATHCNTNDTNSCTVRITLPRERIRAEWFKVSECRSREVTPHTFNLRFTPRGFRFEGLDLRV